MLYSATLGTASLGSLTLGGLEEGIPVAEASLNNWGDAVALVGVQPGLSLSDDLNNWADFVPDEGAYTSILGDIGLGYFSLGEVRESGFPFGDSPTQSIDVSDTLSITEAQRLHLGLILSDSNTNNWNDAAGVDFLVFTQNQTITVASDLSTRPGPGNSPPKAAWKDGVNSTLTPFGDIDIAAEDLETFLNAYAQLGIGLIFSDTLTLSDASLVSGTPGAVAFDSMFFNIGDAAQVALGSPKTAADTLNNLSDTVSILLQGALEAGDTLNLSDNLATSLTSLPNTSDTLVISDSALLVLGVAFSVSDTNSANWADFFTNGPASTTYEVSEEDTLTMSDAASASLSASLTSYLRRYLNDVVN